MLTTRQYADLHGYNYYSVLSWCKRGVMDGAVKAPLDKEGKCFVYMIPKDTPAPPLRRTGRKRMKFGKAEKYAVPRKRTASVVPKRTEREISLFIQKHCGTMTYRAMSRALGIPTLEIRAIYDRLHARYGI